MTEPQPTRAQEPSPESWSFTVNGRSVEVDGGQSGRASLLDILRDRLGLLSVKDGCSPQGQCGCCTVLVDGQPRVACVTPARRVKGRSVTTLEGVDGERRDRWASSFCAAGASQCGFCTPGIIMRLEGASRAAAPAGEAKHTVDQALLAHLCRCTGWQTIAEAWDLFHRASGGQSPDSRSREGGSRGGLSSDGLTRDYEAAAQRAAIEGGAPQRVGPEVALGRGGFAADTAPSDALVALRAADGAWVVGATLDEARQKAGKVQGRRTTAPPQWPLTVPPGAWDVTLRTTWVDPAYLETDASWCAPGGVPSSVAANGGAFGAKPVGTPDPAGPDATDDRFGALAVGPIARGLADQHGQPVLALASREDVARFGPKRPPVAAGISSDGTAWFRVVETPGIEEAIRLGFGDAGLVDEGRLRIEQVAVPGPPTSAALRAAGWAEAVVLQAGLRGSAGVVRAPNGAEAEAEVVAGVIRVAVRCGRVLDEVVLRSYCIGAAHMAWSWLTSEALAVDDDGVVHDLTVRSFGVLRAVDTPTIEVEIRPSEGDPINGSDAVFAAVAAAGWLATGRAQDWPVGLD